MKMRGRSCGDRRSSGTVTLLLPCWTLCVLLLCVEMGVTLAATTSGPVSFFGSSHISVRVQEARSTSDIFFRLRTRRADSMLFLAAGRQDYCLVVLDSGKIKVHINLGAGETEIASEAPFVLNDMNWHSVNLTRRGSQLSLLVDNHLTKETLPSRFHELNIHFGIWLGGLAGFNEIFLGNLPSFRGCMSDITYNQEDVLTRAKTHLGQIYGVTWNCSDEFEASSQDPYGLMLPSSYIISRLAISRQGTVVKMAILPYPSDSDGLIFYVSGVSSRPDYVALEIRQGRLRLVAEMGSGPLLLQSSLNVTDNQWHPLVFEVSPFSLVLRVDNQTWTSELSGRGGSRHLDVSELVYLGLEESRRTKVRSQGLIDRSFRGCVKEFTVDEKLVGLPEVDVTSNITTRCNCGLGITSCTSTTHLGGSNKNKTVVSSRDNGIVTISTFTDVGELEIMRVTSLQVAEGDSALITTKNLKMTLELSKFGIRESGVLFRINKAPLHGRVEVATRTAGSTSRSGETFSLLDVAAGRVRYFHDNTESYQDLIELSLKLMETPGFLLPAYLQDERVVSLPIEITSVDDAPDIRVLPGGVLRLAEGTKIRLTLDVITALDPDTQASDLHFSVISMGATGEKKGFLEIDGKAIKNFTQADLLANRVWYQDQGQSSSSKLALKVSDGSSVSPVTILRIETFPLRIGPEVNTGLEVANVMGTSTAISSANLSFTSNAGDQGLIIEYHVISSPKAGTLQLRRTNGQWTSTDHFTQLDLQGTRLRYVLQRPSEVATEDEFTFHVSLADSKMPSEFRLRIKILPLRLQQMSSNTIYLNESTQGPLALQYKTFPLSLPDTAITYTIVQPPRLGYLTLASPKSQPAFTFTQADILANKIIYSFKFLPLSPVNDDFMFNVSTSHLEITLTSGPFRYDIQHITRKRPQSVTIKPLIVVEAGREVLSQKILRIRVPGDEGQTFFYNVTSGPNHGHLEKERELASLATPSALQTVDRFSTQDLERGRLSYVHDGSETPRDRIELVSWSQTLNFMFVCQMDIIVKGVNNHPPKKAPTASLSVNVVVGGKRRLTPTILDYWDADFDSERTALKYTTKGNSNGGIGYIYDTSKSTSRPIFQWTQADIDGGMLIFKHEGTETQGTVFFWVTDGKFIVNGTLSINAGNPWIHVVNTSTLIAKKGSFAKLMDKSIVVDTNMDVDSSEVRVRVVDGPHHGVIKVNGSGAGEFTLGDISAGQVVYENDAVMDAAQDGFGFEVSAGETSRGPQHFDISIYPEAYWTPLVVGANKSVVVNENSSAVISQTSLHITNPYISPSHIVYTLTRPPSHGYLAIDPNHSNEESDDYVTMWDQTIINEARLFYVQSEPNKTHDSMEFHVTNGVLTLENLRLNFIVIPSTVFLSSTPIIINEGSSCILNFTNLHSSQSYFSDKLSEIKVLSKPVHGTLGLIPRPEVQVQSFPYSALLGGQVVYSHSGAEAISDNFTVQGVAQVADESGTTSKKFSLPHVVRIQVISTNDQFPVVANNTGVTVFMGSSIVLTNSHLATIDEDSDENQLIFYVVGTRGGFPALKVKPEEPLTNFTQAQLNQGLIVFTHKGVDTKPATFDFEVSDGLNEAGKETFKVSVRKPELSLYQGRVPLAVFPFTHAPIKPENLLVRCSDEREVHFQVTTPPSLGQVVLDGGDGKYVAVSVFSQSNVSMGKVYYEHLRGARGGQRFQDVIQLIATSKFADPLTNVSVDVEVSVSGAALGGLQRYVVVNPVEVKEGGQASITTHNINLTAVIEFIGSMQLRGNLWRGGLPTLRLQVSDVPRHGWLVESDEHRLRPGAELIPSLLTTNSYIKYMHDDSETTSDQITFSLWLTSNGGSNTTSLGYTDGGLESSTWLLNITVPVVVSPVNDQRFTVVPSKVPVVPVVQGHWRKLTRNDLLVSDPDTPPAHIVYEVLTISHGRIISLPSNLPGASGGTPGLISTTTPANLNPMVHGGIIASHDIDLLKEMSPVEHFTQADVDGESIVFYHSGPLAPVIINLQVSDGQHGPQPVSLHIPVQPLTLQALQPVPMRIQQGNNVQHLALPNIPFQTNGHPFKLLYNITRYPLHGKLLLKDKTTLSPVFSHQQLLQGELSYVQTDMSVTNDSFVLQASFDEPEFQRRPLPVTWLVNVVAIPLLKRIKEVRSFVRGFAVGGIIAPDETEFSVSYEIRTTVTLALLDASPLAALTGANPIYEILLPPKQGNIYRINKGHVRYTRAIGRKAGRFTHEDVRRGTIVYSPEVMSNDIYPTRQNSQADEFIFRVLAPGVQPAIGVAKFQIHNGYYDPDKGHTEIISDGSTDPATKRSGGGGRLRDITFLITPQIKEDPLAIIGIIIAAVMTLSLFLVVGIRCTCSKKRGRRRQSTRGNSANNGVGLNNVEPNKTNGIGIIDAFASTSMMDPCASDSEAGLRPLMMSALSPRSSRNKVSMSRTATTTTGSESGSWTSSMIRNEETPPPPQCRVTPLCPPPSGSGDSSGITSLNLNITCPLLPPTPICDTFTSLPEELDPPEPYGFSYANLPPPLEIPPVHEEETAFHSFSSNSNQIINSNSSTMTRGTMTLPHSHSLHSHSANHQGTNTPTGSATLGGTLRRQTSKNQYWV